MLEKIKNLSKLIFPIRRKKWFEKKCPILMWHITNPKEAFENIKQKHYENFEEKI